MAKERLIDKLDMILREHGLSFEDLDLRDQLLLLGCEIVEESKDKIVAYCTAEQLKRGVTTTRAKSVSVKKEDDRFKLEFER